MNLPTNDETQGIRTVDLFVFWSALPLWIIVFLAGTPTQSQYVKLAGLISLVGFVVNDHPALFGKMLSKAFPVAGAGPAK